MPDGTPEDHQGTNRQKWTRLLSVFARREPTKEGQLNDFVKQNGANPANVKEFTESQFDSSTRNVIDTVKGLGGICSNWAVFTYTHYFDVVKSAVNRAFSYGGTKKKGFARRDASPRKRTYRCSPLWESSFLLVAFRPRHPSVGSMDGHSHGKPASF